MYQLSEGDECVSTLSTLSAGEISCAHLMLPLAAEKNGE